MNITPRHTAAIVVSVLVLASCGGDTPSGPDLPADGSYSAYASSQTGALPDSTLEITRNEVVILEERGSVQVARSDGETSYLLCPPSGRGTPEPLDQSVTVGGETFTSPALFGDCGVTSPRRVTLIDLDSFDGGETAFPFTRWIEFCDVTDSDC